LFERLVGGVTTAFLTTGVTLSTHTIV
jgi:hypothetical protein